ncbi:MAG TPA: hypothetical protein VH143_25790 [Kofleriaceae bacterium]|jgi:aryl carrier-like protein|nr:hypothetical protein [Kofleriaceae bacterium]
MTELVVDRAIEVITDRGGPRFSRNDRSITAAFVRAVLRSEVRDARYLLLQLVAPVELADTDLMRAWWNGIDALKSLSLTYAWGSKQRRARFRSLAADPTILAAIQGAAAMGERVPRDMLAVLVADGSDASIDALIPHLGSALDSRDARLEWLRALSTHAADTPRVRALLAELEAAYVDRNSKSPALALGSIIGIGVVDELWFSYRFGSTERDEHAARVQASLGVDSRSARWFHVYISPERDAPSSHYGVTWSAEDDRLGLGVCDPAELPAWLARAATRLQIHWEPGWLSTSLRGKKRERLMAWLSES